MKVDDIECKGLKVDASGKNWMKLDKSGGD